MLQHSICALLNPFSCEVKQNMFKPTSIKLKNKGPTFNVGIILFQMGTICLCRASEIGVRGLSGGNNLPFISKDRQLGGKMVLLVTFGSELTR